MNEIDAEKIDERARLVTEECGGIQPPMEAFYIYSIIYSAGRSNEAFIRYEVGSANKNSAALIVSAVHEALSHAASLSRFFWPSKFGGKTTPALRALKERRAKTLRDAFDLTESSPLKDRQFRDALEHFDERLDRFLLDDLAGNFFPAPMVENHTLSDEPTGKIFKLVDPKDSCFVLLGNKYFFAPIRKEVFRIFEAAECMDRNGCQLE